VVDSSSSSRGGEQHTVILGIAKHHQQNTQPDEQRGMLYVLRSRALLGSKTLTDTSQQRA
jgi:hypothetical protein